MATGIGFRKAVEATGMPFHQYLLKVLAPTAAMTVGAAVALPLVLPSVFTGLFLVVPYVIPVLCIGAVLAYPFQVAQSRQHVMDHNMHYFITHMGVLATSRVPRVDLFSYLGDKVDEYGPLAKECKKIATLVKKWNMTLAEACRFVARRTPSELFSDFLERFAFGVESGAEIESYLVSEQEVVMSDYKTMYDQTLNNIDNISTLYNGMMMAIIFIAMFGLLMPILVGGSSTVVLLLVLLGAVVLQISFLFLIHTTVPPDPVWADLGRDGPLWDAIREPLPAAAAAALAIGVTLTLFSGLDALLVLPISATPLLVPGILAGRAEGGVKRRDDNYPAFIRSLGASTAARGGDERQVLRRLRHHDFGPLTENVRALFNRLQLRIDDAASWDYFTTEAGSRLIERFTSMYDEAVGAGGRPDATGRIISDNMVGIIGLRKLRYQKASSFRGTLFGLAAALSFGMFIGIGTLSMLTGLFTEFGSVGEAPIDMPTVIHTAGIDIPQIQLTVVVLLLVNAAISALMIRLVDGGAYVRALEDFPTVLWVSNLIALASMALLDNMTNVAL